MLAMSFALCKYIGNDVRDLTAIKKFRLHEYLKAIRGSKEQQYECNKTMLHARAKNIITSDCHSAAAQTSDGPVEYSFSERQPLYPSYCDKIKLINGEPTYRRVMYNDHDICIPCQLVKNGREVVHLHLESAKFFTDGTSARVFKGFDEF